MSGTRAEEGESMLLLPLQFLAAWLAVWLAAFCSSKSTISGRRSRSQGEARRPETAAHGCRTAPAGRAGQVKCSKALFALATMAGVHQTGQPHSARMTEGPADQGRG